MTKIELPFGKGKIEAQIPEERIQEFWFPVHIPIIRNTVKQNLWKKQ